MSLPKLFVTQAVTGLTAEHFREFIYDTDMTALEDGLALRVMMGENSPEAQAWLDVWLNKWVAWAIEHGHMEAPVREVA